MSATAALVPVYDVDKAIVRLQGDLNGSLSSLLAELATIPVPETQPSSKMPVPVAERLGETLMRAVSQLPKVFGSVKPPASRRKLFKSELAKLEAEKMMIDQSIKALGARKDEIHAMLSVHFDVVAEEAKIVDENAPKDAKGHYLIASPGNPEKAPIDGSSQEFTRERTGDKVIFNAARLEVLYRDGEISRADYLACTRPNTGRVFDEEKLSAMLLTKTKRARGKRLIDLIGDFKRGTNSINLRAVK
ncbi:hypothetical protein E6R60_26245 [Streptomyces sp. A0642]|uniref:hypothetical protein n=1 Tax=Streptomyces sp. A0642 TaxID=2563100 RepID=UPI0010A297D4|nr:hypothetical protein [Streptomyces sp. A0642]THA72437.1 hypothetical protein E6R60_26245 [Streptomyces sp. A0642]